MLFEKNTFNKIITILVGKSEVESVFWHSALCCVGSSQFQIIPGSSRNNELLIEGTVKAEQHWGETLLNE